MASRRVQVLLEEEDRRSFEDSARREGVSLSAWLREAGRDRLTRQRERKTFRTRSELGEFFDECRRREQGIEPDWEEHERVISRSIADGRASS